MVAIRMARLTTEAVFAPHAVPAIAVVGRLDQRIGKIAQHTLIVGQRIFRWRQAHAGDGVATDPGMHVVVDQLRPHPAKIAVGRAAA
jgi:hypothetical protein